MKINMTENPILNTRKNINYFILPVCCEIQFFDLVAFINQV